MTLNGLGLFILFAFALLLAGGMIALSSVLGRQKPSAGHLIPYECGIDPVAKPRHRLHVKFFLIAVIFIIFDVEVVFLYPWAVVFRDFVARGEGLFVFLEMMIFLGVLVIGLLYLWGRGALEWEE
ncbi:MAG: NADH-quinone oxidoreductase subunit A [Deltaproteobacteria bacterium]|nr:NADH-quinone oxidoreductase subunit A [Deltaproteobacteria bacterium]